MAACIVCNQRVSPNDSQTVSDRAKLQSRLAHVLCEMVPVDAVMCVSCQCDLSQMETYYSFITTFRKRYAETAKQRLQLKESQNHDRNLLSETADYKSGDFQNIFGAGNSFQPPMDSDVRNDAKVFAPFVKIENFDVRTVTSDETDTQYKRKAVASDDLSDGFEDNAWDSDVDEPGIIPSKPERLPGPDAHLGTHPVKKIGKGGKKRGRPKKTPLLQDSTPVKSGKKLGRPRKSDQSKSESLYNLDASHSIAKNTESPVSTIGKKKRGRPKKGTMPNAKDPKEHGKPKTTFPTVVIKTESVTDDSQVHERPVSDRPARKSRPVHFKGSDAEDSSEGEQNGGISDEDDASYIDETGGLSPEDSESDANDPDFGLEPLKKHSVTSPKPASSGQVVTVKSEGTEVEPTGSAMNEPQPTTSQGTVVDVGQPVKKKIGRPRKIVVDAGPVVKRPRGRPRREDTDIAPLPKTPHRYKYYNKPQTCEICQKVLCSKASYKIHMASHSDARPFECDECKMTFKTSTCLNRHKTIHSGERRFKCKLCDRTCRRRKDLEKHMAVHSTEHPYKCEECNRTYKLPEYLKTHIRFVHVQGKTFLCSQCGYATYSAGSLRSHMISHNEKVPRDKPFKCGKCGKGFATKVRCERHEETHVKNREKSLCPICGKAVYNKWYLKQHIKQHTGESDIACNLCGKTFTAPSGLRLHMMGHRGENPLKCDICGKGFRLTTNLKNHLMMHKDERPWRCDVCDLNFRRKPNLKDHLLTKKHIETAAKAGKSESTKILLEQLTHYTRPFQGLSKEEAVQPLEKSSEQTPAENKRHWISTEQPAEEAEPSQVSPEQPVEENKPFEVPLIAQPLSEQTGPLQLL